jgi:hypothetical protein
MMIGPSAPNGPPLPPAMPKDIGFDTATSIDLRLLSNRIAWGGLPRLGRRASASD